MYKFIEVKVNKFKYIKDDEVIQEINIVDFLKQL